MAVIVLLAGFLFAHFYKGQDMDAFRLPVYFYNPAAFRLETTEHNLPAGDERTQLNAAVALFTVASRIPAITGVWPDGEDFLVDWYMNGTVLEAVFPREYYEIPPMEEALFRAAFVWTMTGLPFINQVAIRLEGDDFSETPYLLESRETVIINPSISSMRLVSRTFTLYFVNETLEALVPAQFASSTVDMDQIERYIVALLIDGPNHDELVSVIPSETRILDITSEEYTCYVNLSSDFANRFTGGTSTARLMVYSIVNTLTRNLSHVRRVQFLIDAERVDQFHGMTDFHQAFEWNETLIIGYAPPEVTVEEE
jgi:hypothetical protein